MISIPKVELPAGFSFVYDNNLAPNEIIELRTKIGWSGDTIDRWKDCIAQSLAVVGIRNSQGLLVGMGCIAGNVRHAVLCDLVVEPAYQRIGLGKALLYERMDIAEKMDITYMYTDLSDSNPLRGKYTDLGFVNTGRGLFRDKNRLN